LSALKRFFKELAMRERIIRRYSSCFKQQVIAELESGRFESLAAAREHYGVLGPGTILRWVRRYGKNQLQPRVVRVETPGEEGQVRRLRRQVAQLEKALGRTQAENVLNAELLKLACAELGQEVWAFKKKSAGLRCEPPSKRRA
jgi:transposase-like protein